MRNTWETIKTKFAQYRKCDLAPQRSTAAGGLQLSMAAVWRHLSVVVIACVLVGTTPEVEGANELDAWLWTSADGASD